MYYSYSVQVGESKFGGKGLFAAKEFQASETILSVPSEYFITYDYLIKKYPSVQGITSDKRVEFSFCLSLQMADPDSPYQQYFQSIPPFYSNPISQPLQSYSQFQHQPFIRKLKVKKQKITTETKKLISKYQNEVMLEDVLRCFCIVESRTLFYQTELDPKSEVGVLVPLYDMANHSEQVNKTNIYQLFYYDKQSKSYVLKAYRHYQKGEEIYISYGSYDNDHFIQYYGFIPHNNPNNVKVQIDWSIIPFEKQQLQSKLSLIRIRFPEEVEEGKELRLRGTSSIYIDSSGEIQQNQLLKLLCLKPINKALKGVKELNQALKNLGDDYYEIEQYDRILKSLKDQLLSRYKTDLDFDLELHRTTEDPFLNLCVLYRTLLKSQITAIPASNL